jgi:hypothetical protein
MGFAHGCLLRTMRNVKKNILDGCFLAEHASPTTLIASSTDEIRGFCFFVIKFRNSLTNR